MGCLSRLYERLKKRSRGGVDEDEGEDVGGLFFEFRVLELATNFYAENNLLGRGGFGPVYKGLLPSGQQIAVKKLSLGSRQGLKEFTNEVKLLLKVQHKNLVTLLGCCVEGTEKMLIYEYLPNKSLDNFIFNQNKSALLVWSKRFEIITGLAKGLLYLHEEGPERIIHRDIKASNILLDDQLRPKIADFGLARLFPGEDTHLNTFKISGTHGYMAPEYAMHGYLSVKCDVFSFGVLVLEIVSGRKNYDRQLGVGKADLLSYAWNLFEEGNTLEIMDSTLAKFSRDEAYMCVQLGLLCCQASVASRPDMNSIHLMLLSDSFNLPKPTKPAIQGRQGRWTTTSSTMSNAKQDSKSSVFTNSDSDTTYSTNSISITLVNEGR